MAPRRSAFPGATAIVGYRCAVEGRVMQDKESVCPVIASSEEVARGGMMI